MIAALIATLVGFLIVGIILTAGDQHYK